MRDHRRRHSAGDGGLAAGWMGWPKEQRLLLASGARYGKEIPPRGEARHTASPRPLFVSRLGKEQLDSCAQEIPGSLRFTNGKAKRL